MGGFPPRERLVHTVSSLIRHLPEHLGELLDAERFGEGAGALGRLADPEALAAGAAAMDPAEAAWMADLLLERWARLAEVELDPAVAIVGPDDLWLSRRPRTVELRIATLGVDEGWTAEWTGDAEPGKDGRSARLTAEPPRDDGAVAARLRVRVIGRAEGRRCVLVASRAIQLRRPVISLDESRRRLVIRDQTGAPAAAVEVEVAGEPLVTGPSGLLELSEPLDEGVVVRVAGAAVK